LSTFQIYNNYKYFPFIIQRPFTGIRISTDVGSHFHFHRSFSNWLAIENQYLTKLTDLQWAYSIIKSRQLIKTQSFSIIQKYLPFLSQKLGNSIFSFSQRILTKPHTMASYLNWTIIIVNSHKLKLIGWQFTTIVKRIQEIRKKIKANISPSKNGYHSKLIFPLKIWTYSNNLNKAPLKAQKGNLLIASL